MDGFETTLRIKGNTQLANIPVIFRTGLTESEHVVEAFEVGGVDYIRKSVNLNELLARVRVHMAQGRAAYASAASLDATERMMLATDPRGSVLWCTRSKPRVPHRGRHGPDVRLHQLVRHHDANRLCPAH